MTARLRQIVTGISVAAIVVTIGVARAGRQQSDGAPPMLARAVDPVIAALWSGYDTAAAIEHVRVIGPTWRLGGNASFDAAIDRVRDRLQAGGFDRSNLRVEEYGGGAGRGWEHTIGTLALVKPGAADEIVLSRETHRVALAINSFPTPAGGVVARLVDVGRGAADADYAGKDLKGAVVLGDAALGTLWRRAVTTGGAIGVISTSLPSYINPDAPGAKATPRDQWDILQWGNVPFDEARKGFGFKASPRAAATLRKALADRAAGQVEVRVTIAATFSGKPTRTLIAEFPGTMAADERVVLAAHVQEPGANDNASGVATLAELAHALDAAIRSGSIPRPKRTITMLWLDEIGGSRQWIRDHPAEAKNVKYMFSLDMTGEDVARTGGAFLIERWPDPGAVWDRPWDPHSEWGRGDVKPESLTGDIISDLHLAICRRVARRTGWNVTTNPYEGGSDHTVFGDAGVPSLLNWHFTDRYYHTNMDTPDKTSAAEMRNVGVAVGTSAWLMASADTQLAVDVGTLVGDAGRLRIGREQREGAAIAAAAADRAAATALEATIVAAWRKWYGEAVMSASRLVVGPATPELEAQLRAIAEPFVR
ncbi:MAG TPA: M28 family peptidase [Vicinamibacterales bacterium]|nr:M28 family peptidase [Vicinamibacterales bacterium]